MPCAQILPAPAALQNLQARIDVEADAILAFVARKQACTCAYVTFEQSQAAKEALTALSWYEFSFGSAERFRGKHALRVRRAPEASDILWENTVHAPLERSLRTWLTVALSFSVLAAAVYLVSWRAGSVPEMMRDVDCSQVRDVGWHKRRPCGCGCACVCADQHVGHALTHAALSNNPRW